MFVKIISVLLIRIPHPKLLEKAVSTSLEER